MTPITPITHKDLASIMEDVICRPYEGLMVRPTAFQVEILGDIIAQAPCCDPIAPGTYLKALKMAIRCDSTPAVELILPLLSPEDLQEGLTIAVQELRPEAVARLIPLTDPAADNSAALRLAVASRPRSSCADREACVRALLSVSDATVFNSEPLRSEIEGAMQPEVIQMLLSASDAKAAHSSALRSAARRGDPDVLALLLPVSDPEASQSDALMLAAKLGHAECVELLLLASNIAEANNRALFLAAENGHAKCVRALLPFSNPLADDSYALCMATENGHAECVKLLIPVSDPKSDDSYALRRAAELGDSECVRLLAPVSDIFSRDSFALRSAVAGGHCEAVAALLLAEPSLASRCDLRKLRAKASAEGDVEVEQVLAAFIEQIEITSLLAAEPGCDRRATTSRL